jgi:ribosomal protein L33, bacterial type
MVRVGITLACTECKQRNYRTTKDKKKNAEKMEVRKHCKFCNAHTVHRETK